MSETQSAIQDQTGGEPSGLVIRDLSVNLTTDRGPVRPVDGVNLEVKPGQRVALVGESGCGKSMLLRGLLRFIPGSVLDGLNGQARFDGTNLIELSERDLRGYRGRRIAMVFQDALSRLNPTMTVGRQVGEVLRTRNAREREEQVRSLFRSVGLDTSSEFRGRYPHELSGGMRQRVLIAIALAGDPELLIADEPTTALDVTVQAQILDTILTVVQDRGMSLLMVTHDLGVVAETCDFVYVMYAGHVVESGPVNEVFARPSHPYTKGLLECVLDVRNPPQGAVPTLPGVVPAPADMPPGCRFKSRCPSAMALCDTEPPQVAVAEHQVARCWLHAPTRPDSAQTGPGQGVSREGGAA